MDGLEFLVTGAFEILSFAFESAGHLLELLIHGTDAISAVVESAEVIDTISSATEAGLQIAELVCELALDTANVNFQDPENYNQYKNLK